MSDTGRRAMLAGDALSLVEGGIHDAALRWAEAPYHSSARAQYWDAFRRRVSALVARCDVAEGRG